MVFQCVLSCLQQLLGHMVFQCAVLFTATFGPHGFPVCCPVNSNFWAPWFSRVLSSLQQLLGLSIIKCADLFTLWCPGYSSLGATKTAQHSITPPIHAGHTAFTTALTSSTQGQNQLLPCIPLIRSLHQIPPVQTLLHTVWHSDSYRHRYCTHSQYQT